MDNKTNAKFTEDQTFPQDTVVVCIDNDDLSDTTLLTVGKTYTVLNEPKFQIWVGIEIGNDDNDFGRFYHFDRFVTLQEWRRKKLSFFLEK